MYTIINNELYHHGILGQKWGVRRYQMPNGTLTDAGRKRYGVNGKVQIDDRGRIVDSNNKSIRNKTRKLVENRMLKDNKISDKLQDINSREEESRGKYELAWAKYKKAQDEYGSNYVSLEDPNSFIRARANNILLNESKKTYEDAKKEYEAVKKEVNSFVADYMNKNIDSFTKSNPAVRKMVEEQIDKHIEGYKKELNQQKEWTKNTYKINDKIAEKYFDNFDNGKRSYSDIAKYLNKESEKYISPTGEKLHYTADSVKRNLEEYGNLDRAYTIRRK